MRKACWVPITAACIGVGMVACGDKYATIQPPGYTPQIALQPRDAQPPLPSINIKETSRLFSLVDSREVGDKVGTLEMRNEGILVHPGETTPTRVTFRLSRSFHSITVRTFIAALPPGAAMKEAGTTGVEYFLDGKSNGRTRVDRNSKEITTLNLVGVNTLTVVVDNGEGKSWFDWLMLGVVSLK